MKLGTLLLFYAIWLCFISSVKIPLQETLDKIEQKQLNDLIKETKNNDKNSDYTMSLDDVASIENKTDNKMYMTDISNKDREVIKSLNAKKEDKDNKEYMIDLDNEDKEIIQSLIGKDNMKYMMDLDDKEKNVIKSLTKEIIKEKTKQNKIANKHIDTVQPKQNQISNETPIKREHQINKNQIHKVNDRPTLDKNSSMHSSVNAQNSMTIKNEQKEQNEPSTNSAITTTTSSPTGGTVTTTNINIKIGNLREDKKECNNIEQVSKNQELLSKISSKLDLLIYSNNKESIPAKEDPKIIDKLLSIIKQKIK